MVAQMHIIGDRMRAMYERGKTAHECVCASDCAGGEATETRKWSRRK